MKSEEKVATATGGNCGIGQAICLRLLQGGAKIVISYRSHPEEAQDTKEKIEQIDSQAHVVQAVLSEVEQVDILVNSANLEKRINFET